MSDCQIPNAVGRIDEIIESVQQGDRSLAMELLHGELERLKHKANVKSEELGKVLQAITEVSTFQSRINKDAGFFESVTNRLQKAKPE